MKHPPKLQRRPAFTLVEILVVVSIIAVIALLSLSMIRKGLDAARTSASITNLKNLHSGIMTYAADHGMQLPVNWWSSTPEFPVGSRDLYWYKAMAKYLYPDVYERAPSYYGSPLLIRDTGYKDTPLVSPNAENRNDSYISVSSYGYNFKFDITNRPYTYLSRYDNSRTCMFADNSGRTHVLGPGPPGHARVINPRNGASGRFKADGKAAAIYLDGHAETLSAVQATEINADSSHQFWGR